MLVGQPVEKAGGEGGGENSNEVKEGKTNQKMKNTQNLECVNGTPASEGHRDPIKTNGAGHLASDVTDEAQTPKKKKKRRRKKPKKGQQSEAEGMARSTPGQSEVTEGERSAQVKSEGEITPGAKEGGVEVAAANNGEPKKKRKRKKRRKNKPDQAGGTSQDSAEGESRAAEVKPESVKEKKEDEQPVAAPSTDDSKPPLTKAQRRKERKRKIKRAIEALNNSNAAQNATPTPNENAAAATAGTAVEQEPGAQGQENARKRKMIGGDGSSAIVTDTKQDDATNEGGPPKKMKQEAAEGNHEATTTPGLGNEGPAKKRKRKKRKKKQNPVSDSTDGGNKEGMGVDEDEGSPAKKPRTEATTTPGDTPNREEPKPEPTTPPPNKKKKRRRSKKKQKGIEPSLPNTPGGQPSGANTAETRPTAPAIATTAPAASTQGGDAQAPLLHPSCTGKENKKRITKCWRGGGKEGLTLKEGGIEVIKSPFTCCLIPQLLQDEAFLDGVKKELDHVELLAKNNDLYKFRQTGDLKGITTPFIAGLRHLLYTSVRQWLIEVTGIPLSDTVDMGSSRYSHTDVLLCHDDELEGRRIAYVLYLVPPSWGPEDGGTLDLFATDGDGHPSDIARSITPKNNSLVFFEVSPVSFHQVSEVLSRDKTRLSINGWFHGPPVPRPKRSPPPASPLQAPAHLEEDAFYKWINPTYLDMKTQKDIRVKFCSESELKLENFLNDEVYERLSGALGGEGLAWKYTGPANRQRYEILSPDTLPRDAKEFREFLGCEALFLVLSQLTGLKLHPMAPQDSDDEEEEEKESSAKSNPQCRVEVQRWGPGSYTLIRDDCVDGRSALDVFLYANVSERWSQHLGGHVSYITKDEDEELLTVGPQSNCLCLVYRDPQTLRFTKYISSASRDLGDGHSRFHSFSSTYYE